MPGSIGLLPSANLSLFPVGEVLLNPFGTILTVAMILPYSLNLPEETKAVEGPVCVALEVVLRATDFGVNTTTEEVGDAVFEELRRFSRFKGCCTVGVVCY
ncbi:3-isopropylmalate dehydrogenase [Fusarium agapanthi]|uniref:3-isopropylmalate dehydrogenase n=1 Tax=Fusarium agapanthi TaxID=1803897 RepID=A0A9P5B6K7_9HYPO|nr:3-isopropylmalate dehydrogenase [Fusarium agapanthi]